MVNPPIHIWFLLLVSSWAAATVSGLVGFGGAVILVPILVHAIGAKAAVPVLTIAQVFGNASRAWIGYRNLVWRQVAIFSAGALPTAVLGSALFTSISTCTAQISIAITVLVLVVLRRLGIHPARGPFALAALGCVVGFLSATAGTAGPLSASAFFALSLPHACYIASEAMAALLMHVTKSVVYQRFDALGNEEMLLGAAMGGAMVMGSLTGKALVGRWSQARLAAIVEVLLVAIALELIVSVLCDSRSCE